MSFELNDFINITFVKYYINFAVTLYNNIWLFCKFLLIVHNCPVQPGSRVLQVPFSILQMLSLQFVGQDKLH